MMNWEKFLGSLIPLLEEREYSSDLIGRILADVLTAYNYARAEPDEPEEGEGLTSQYCACGDELEELIVGQDLEPPIFVCRRCHKIWADGWKWG